MDDTKIRYLLVKDAVYKVTAIDISILTIDATKTDMTVDKIPENEIWSLADLKEFSIHLKNGPRIIDLEKWKEINSKV